MSEASPSGSAPESIMKLLAALTRGTTANKVAWQKLAPYEYRFNGAKGHVILETTPDEEAPFVFALYDLNNTILETYEAPTRFSDASLDAALSALWSAIYWQERGRTVEPLIASLIEDAGGEVPRAADEPDESQLDDLPF